MDTTEGDQANQGTKAVRQVPLNLLDSQPLGD